MLQACAGGGLACLQQFERETGLAYSHVYVRLPVPGSRHPADQCCHIARALAADPRHTLVYAGPGAQVYARR